MVRQELRSFILRELGRRDWSLRDFAARLGYANHGPVSAVLGEGRSVRSVPLRRIDDWIRALRLEGTRAEYLRELLHLLDASPELQAKWLARRRLQQRLSAELSELMKLHTVPPAGSGDEPTQELARLRAEVSRLRSLSARQAELLRQLHAALPAPAPVT